MEHQQTQDRHDACALIGQREVLLAQTLVSKVSQKFLLVDPHSMSFRQHMMTVGVLPTNECWHHQHELT